MFNCIWNVHFSSFKLFLCIKPIHKIRKYILYIIQIKQIVQKLAYWFKGNRNYLKDILIPEKKIMPVCNWIQNMSEIVQTMILNIYLYRNLNDIRYLWKMLWNFNIGLLIFLHCQCTKCYLDIQAKISIFSFNISIFFLLQHY